MKGVHEYTPESRKEPLRALYACERIENTTRCGYTKSTSIACDNRVRISRGALKLQPAPKYRDRCHRVFLRVDHATLVRAFVRQNSRARLRTSRD